MANFDPIAKAGEFIRTLKIMAAGVDEFAAAGNVNVRWLKDRVDDIGIRMARANAIITELQTQYTNEQIKTRLSERLAVSPADIVAAYLTIQAQVDSFLAWYEGTAQAALPVEQSYSAAEKRHLPNQIDVQAQAGLLTRLGDLQAALAPFSD